MNHTKWKLNTTLCPSAPAHIAAHRGLLIDNSVYFSINAARTADSLRNELGEAVAVPIRVSIGQAVTQS